MKQNNIGHLWELPAVNDESLQAIERITEQKVSRTISALEIAISAWDDAKKKPEGLRQDMEKIKWFYSELCNWEKKSRSAISEKNIVARKRRLKQFYNICREFQEH